MELEKWEVGVGDDSVRLQTAPFLLLLKQQEEVVYLLV
jgi:hypothetical protein